MLSSARDNDGLDCVSAQYCPEGINPQLSCYQEVNQIHTQLLGIDRLPLHESTPSVAFVLFLTRSINSFKFHKKIPNTPIPSPDQKCNRRQYYSADGEV